MSTFYLLPPRDDLACRFASYLQTWFPGAHPASDELPDVLAAVAETCPGTLAVFADELPDGRGSRLDAALRGGFGAEPRDRVIDLRHGPAGPESPLATWLVGTPASLS